MSLEYSGIPKFNRQRDLFSTSVGRNQLDSFISKPVSPQSAEDQIFDSITKTFLKGEALKNAISEMNPAGFIPVEPESSVIVSIQRLYQDSNSNVITFGMFKTACDFLAEQSSNIDENWILKYNVIDPNLDHAATVTKHKSISNDGSDWLTCFLEQLSPFAGMLIAGKLVHLSTWIFPETGFDSQGNTGEMRTWAAEGAPVAIALLAELGWTLAEYNRLYKNSNIPSDISDQIQQIVSDPKRREKILTDAGYNYNTLRGNQKYNDHLAIKNYAVSYIHRHQDDLNYHHWISYSQVAESQLFTRAAASMAPVFSNKWRKLYKFNGDISTTDTDIFSVENSDTLEEVKTALNIGLANYIRDLDRTLNTSYDRMYQSLTFEVDPNLVCCLVYILGPIDVSILRQISSLLKVTAQSFYFSLDSLATKLSESMVIAYLNMLNCYLSQIMHNLVKDLNDKLLRANRHFDNAQRYCLGIKPITFSLKIALQYIINFILEASRSLNTLIYNLSRREMVFAENTIATKSVVTLAAFIDRIANGIENGQAICNFNPAIEGLHDSTFGFITMDIGKKFPTMNMAEDARRKHYSNIKGFMINDLGIEVPGTDSDGVPNVYQNKATNCLDQANVNQNIAFGNLINDAIKTNS